MAEKSYLDKKITFYSLLNTASKRWYIIVSIVALSLIISIIYSVTSITPLYSSTSKLYIVNKGDTPISSAEISVSTSLTKDFEVIINDNSIIGEIVKELNYEYTASQIKNFISVSNPEGTRIIELKVLSPDENISQKINKAVCDLLQERVIDIMGIDRISIISQGNLATQSAFTKQSRTVIYSLFAGFCLSLLIIAAISLYNNKISTAKDIEELLNLNVLGTVPYNKNSKPKI